MSATRVKREANCQDVLRRYLPAQAKVVTNAHRVRKGIIASDPHPFTGTINEQKGMELVPAGQTIPDKDLLGVDWYVEGVSA